MSITPADTAPARPSLKKNVAYAMCARVFLALAQFLVLATIVHLGTPEDVGALTLASAIVTPLFFLTSMGMNEVHVVDDFTQFCRADYIVLRFIAGVTAILLTIAVVYFFQDDETRMVQLAAISFAFVRFFGAQSSLNHGMFQRAEKISYMAISTIARGGIGVILFFGVFWVSRNLPLSFAWEAVGWFLTYYIIDRVLLARLGLDTPLSALKQVKLRNVVALAWWVLPIGIGLWMTRAAASVPPMMLASYTDLAAVGLFGTLAYIHSALSMAVGPIGTASAARMRNYYRNGNRQGFDQLTGNIVLVAFAIGVGATAFAWFAGDQVLRVVFGPTYSNEELFTIITFGTGIGLVAMQLQTAVTAAQAFNHRMISSAFAMLAAFVAAYFLIPPYGIYGAGWAMVAMSAARLAFSLFAYRIVLAAIPSPAARSDMS